MLLSRAAFAFVFLIPSIILAQSPTSAPASQPQSGRSAAGGNPTTQPTTNAATDVFTWKVSPKLAAHVKDLVKQLGDRDFEKRENAQRKLTDLGEPAFPALLDYLDNKNMEVAQRVTDVISAPSDLHLRVEIATRLIATTDPDLMERGVRMLFASPIEVYDPFRARTASAKGLHKAIFDVVAEQLAQWKASEEGMQKHAEKHRATKSEGLARTLELHEGSRIYQIEAAYQGALEVMEDFEAESEKATSRPAATTAPAN